MKPTSEQLKALLHDAIWYEILFTFAIPLHDPRDYATWEYVNFTRMGHARVLYAFFETSLSKRYNDDVLAGDCGFTASKIGLPEDDKMRLNKDLFHLTFSRLRHTVETKAWPHNILNLLQPRCIEFMVYIESRKLLIESDEWCHDWKLLLDALRSGQQLLVQRFYTKEGMGSYQLGLGETLSNGNAVLTRMLPRE